MHWLDDRLEHTLRRGREWIAGSKPNVPELKDKATVAMADLLAAQQAQKGRAPVVRLPNGDYIWGNPYQAADPEWNVPEEVIKRQMQQQEYVEKKTRMYDVSRGAFGGIFGK